MATFYTAIYMTVASVVGGKVDNVQYDHLDGFINYFLGLVAIIFNYGGMSSTVEKADVMDENVKQTYDRAYVFAVLYSYGVTIPIGVSAYWSFGSLCQSAPNAFYLFQPSTARTVGVILMSLHECVAFGLFANPLFHIIEKAMKIHGAKFIPRRLGVRLLLCLFFVFLSVLAPFFGVINGLFAAFTTTFATYCIPLYLYNKVFSEDQTKELKKQHPAIVQKLVGYRAMRWCNWFLGTIIFDLRCWLWRIFRHGIVDTRSRYVQRLPGVL